MSPAQRRTNIIIKMEDLGVTVHKLIIESKYSGVRGYVEGWTKAQDEHVYNMEQALDRLEASKAAK